MENKTILIQGAMDIEIQALLEKLEEQEKIVISDYEFYTGKIKNCNVIVSKTLIGTINATIATTIGIEKFRNTYKIIYKCEKCGTAHKNIIANDDDFDEIIKLSKYNIF